MDKEEYGGKVQEQIDIAQKSLNYAGRFAPPQPGPGTTAGDADRWAEIERGSGGK
jgi:hypothetical protein